MEIKGTDKIRGVVELPSIRQQLKNGQSLPISDRDLYNTDVQIAVRMGLIKVSGQPTSQDDGLDDEVSEDRSVRCMNNNNRSLTLEGFSEIKPGASFYLPETRLQDPSIRAAIKRGIIKVVEVKTSSDENEATVNLGRFDPNNPVEQNQPDNEPEETENISVAQKSLVEAMEKAQKNRTRPDVELETNEEMAAPTTIIDDPITEVIEDENPPPVSPQQIRDPKKSSVVWNPNRDKITNTMKGAVISSGKSAERISSPKLGLRDALRVDPDARVTKIAKDDEEPEIIAPNYIDNPNPPPVDPLEGKKSNVVVVNPFGDQVTNTAKESMVWTGAKGVPNKTTPMQKNAEVEFVDEESESERFKKHPILGKKPVPQKKDVEMIPDPDEARRAAHPVLGKKSQNSEIDFVG